jgi:hypothetical protein
MPKHVSPASAICSRPQQNIWHAGAAGRNSHSELQPTTLPADAAVVSVTWLGRTFFSTEPGITARARCLLLWKSLTFAPGLDIILAFVTDNKYNFYR